MQDKTEQKVKRMQLFTATAIVGAAFVTGAAYKHPIIGLIIGLSVSGLMYYIEEKLI